jgi:hypothetical protein
MISAVVPLALTTIRYRLVVDLRLVALIAEAIRIGAEEPKPPA